MDFALTEEHELTRKMVRDFADKEIRPVALEYDEKQEVPMDIVKKMGPLGLLGMAFPPEWGGAGTDNVSYAIAIEELSRADASIGVIAAVNNGLVCDPLYRFGTDAQKERWLRELAQGNVLGAYALTEPGSGSDAAAMASTGRKEGSEWILNGSKIFVTNGAIASILITYARTGEGKYDISAFVVPTDAPGCVLTKKEDKMGIRASDTAAFSLDDCRIPEENLLGEEGKGFNIALATLDGGRIGIAAQALGIAQGAYEEALKYSKEREAFGEPISTFQAIQWKLADMATRIEAARLLTYRAAWLKDQGARHTRESSVAKLYASETCGFVVDQALQIHGGYGYIKEYPVEKYYRDHKITELYEGTSEIQRLVIARELLK